jgi:uncharacterized protein (DUF433 family)
MSPSQGGATDPRSAALRFGQTKQTDQNQLRFTMTAPYQHIITIEPGKRGGQPTIRGMRITVGDVLGWLAAGMTPQEIVADFPELTEADIWAALAFAADRERRAPSAAE